MTSISRGADADAAAGAGAGAAADVGTDAASAFYAGRGFVKIGKGSLPGCSLLVHPDRPELIIKSTLGSHGLIELAYLLFIRWCSGEGSARVSCAIAPELDTVRVAGSRVSLIMQRAQHAYLQECRDVNVLRAVLGHACVLASMGIHHCDFKVNNIVRTASGDPLLIDFGGSSTVTHKYLGRFVTGTYGFMPPEAVLDVGGVPSAERIDVWSLAITILGQFVNLSALSRAAFYAPSSSCAYDHLVALFKFFGTPQPGQSSLCLMAGFEGLHKWPDWPYVRRLSSYREIREQFAACAALRDLLDLLDNMSTLDPAQRFGFRDVLDHPFMASERASIVARTDAVRDVIRAHALHMCVPMPHAKCDAGFDKGLHVLRSVFVTAPPFRLVLPMAASMFMVWYRHGLGLGAGVSGARIAWVCLYLGGCLYGFETVTLQPCLTGSGFTRDDLYEQVNKWMMAGMEANPVCAAVCSPVFFAFDTIQQHIEDASETCRELEDKYNQVLRGTAVKVLDAACIDPYGTTKHCGVSKYCEWTWVAVVDAMLTYMECCQAVPETPVLVAAAKKHLGEHVCPCLL